jgi:hypothetical protein
MFSGKIHLLFSGDDPANRGISQTIYDAGINRLYRITNDGPGTSPITHGSFSHMTIWVTRSFGFVKFKRVYELRSGRSIDVYGSSITVWMLENIQLFGNFDTI